jgi:hypothetical protein
MRAAAARLAWVLGGLFAGASCGSGDPPHEPGPDPSDDAAVPDAPGEPASAIRFIDATAGSGLAAFRQVNGDPQKHYIVESVGGGVALFDADSDGALDVYLTNGSRLEGFAPGAEPRDALFLGRGDGTFRAAGPEAGVGDSEWTGGVRAADVDGDGDADLLLTGFGRDALLVNAAGRFADVAAEVGVADPRWTTGAAFFDYDLDGDLDLYVVRHLAFDRAWIDANARTRTYLGVGVYFGPQGLPGEPDALYRNDAGLFRDVSVASGVAVVARPGYQAVAFDQDADGLVDVYVADDSTPNLLWRNRGDGTFVDVADRLGIARSHEGLDQAGMGIAVGDSNGDGRFDVFVTNFSEDYSTLYEADGNGFFRDRTRRQGLANPTIASLGWGTAMVDLDLDGDLDLFVANGHVFPQMDRFELGTRYRQRNQAFENLGDGRFREVPARDGLLLEEASRGAAFGDVDGDGDVDVVVSNLDAGPTLLLNESRRAGAALRVTVVGAGGNRDAVGARLELDVAGRLLVRCVGVGSGFLSSDESTQTFGVPRDASGLVLRVRWPDGAVDEHVGLAPGSYVARPGALSAR